MAHTESTPSRPLVASDRLVAVIAFVLIVLATCPPARAISSYSYVYIGFMVLWCFVAFLARPSFFLRMKYPMTAALVFCLYTSVVPYLFGNGMIGNRFLSLGSIPLFYWIYRYHAEHGLGLVNRTLALWSMPLVIFVSLRTGWALLASPWIARSIKSGGEYSASLLRQGIGGYEFIYMFVFIVVLLFFIALNGQRLRLPPAWRAAVVALFLVFTLVVILSNYFLALILILLAVAIQLATGKKPALTLGVFALLWICGRPLALFALDAATHVLPQGRTAERLELVRGGMMGRLGGEETLNSRQEVLEASFKGWAEHPFLGIITQPIRTSGGFITGFGQHSQFVDTFALFGLPIGLLQLYFILHPLLTRARRCPPLRGLSWSMAVTVPVLFTFDNVTGPIAFSFFFLYPVVYEWLELRLASGTPPADKSSLTALSLSPSTQGSSPPS